MTIATQPPLITGDSALARTLSTSYEWYTPARYVEAARRVMGRIDMDPASCAEANKIVQASTFYDKETDGLLHDWPGTVWLNPPYCRSAGYVSNQDIWTCRLIAQYKAGITTEAMLLVGSSTDTAWFQRLWAYPVCFTDHRIDFYRPGGSDINRATHGSAFVYLGPQIQRFIEVFQQFGSIVTRISPAPVSLWQTGTGQDTGGGA